MKPPPSSERDCGPCAATRIGRASAEGASDSGCAQAAVLKEMAMMMAGKVERCIDLTLALNSSDELHYKRKATPNGKQKLPRAVLARQRARYVALEFI